MMRKIFSLFILCMMFFSVCCASEKTDQSIYRRKIQKNHRLIILNSGIASLEKRLELIERAQESIELETFVFNTDRAGKIILKKLIEKAQEGVQVRLLLDHYMIGSKIDPYVAWALKKEGIEARFYNSVSKVRLVRYQYRTHRKFMLVDGKEVILGGRNIADEYFDLDHDYNFVDRDVWIEGEIVKDILATFNDLWSHAWSQEISKPATPNFNNDLRYLRNRRSSSGANSQYQRKLHHWQKNTLRAKKLVSEIKNKNFKLKRIRRLGKEKLFFEKEITCPEITFVSDLPFEKSEKKETKILKDIIFNQMLKARKRVVIDSPYFIINKESKKVMQSLTKKRDKKVELLTNSLYSTDAIYVATVFYKNLKLWIDRGLQTYIYSGVILPGEIPIDQKVETSRWGTHSKSYIFDNAFMIGSFNMDPRSYVFSLETGIFCKGAPQATQDLYDNIKKRMKNSYFLEDEKTYKEMRFKRVSFVKKIGYALLKYPSLWMKNLL